jgi:quinol monooxygenase YgiN
VVMEIEYRVCAERVDSFEAFMLNECRESRLRSGCIAWELQKDLTLPDRFVEVVVDASWQEHVRHFDRVTASDQALRAKRLGFHAGPAGPQVRRYLQLSTL